MFYFRLETKLNKKFKKTVFFKVFLVARPLPPPPLSGRATKKNCFFAAFLIEHYTACTRSLVHFHTATHYIKMNNIVYTYLGNYKKMESCTDKFYHRDSDPVLDLGKNPDLA